MARAVVIDGILGLSGSRRVFLAVAPADVLCRISFADVLDEDTGRGYQRRFNPRHSLDFRRYIQAADHSTIPLTLNLRPTAFEQCRIVETRPPHARLEIDADARRILAQVDCQHRLGHLSDLTVSLPFMCYIGLDEREEMEVFNTINGKAHGLGASLLDFHDATLTHDLAGERPELLVALLLHNGAASPWYRQLDLGGTSTSGLQRRASLRTMQKAVKRFFRQTGILRAHPAEIAAQVILAFWQAVEMTAGDAWQQPRKHLLSKGVGVYALMSIAADLYSDVADPQRCDKRFFAARLADFIADIDWSTQGALRGLGGEAGVVAAVDMLRNARNRRQLRAVTHG